MKDTSVTQQKRGAQPIATSQCPPQYSGLHFVGHRQSKQLNKSMTGYKEWCL